MEDNIVFGLLLGRFCSDLHVVGRATGGILIEDFLFSREVEPRYDFANFPVGNAYRIRVDMYFYARRLGMSDAGR